MNKDKSENFQDFGTRYPCHLLGIDTVLAFCQIKNFFKQNHFIDIQKKKKNRS